MPISHLLVGSNQKISQPKHIKLPKIAPQKDISKEQVKVTQDHGVEQRISCSSPLPRTKTPYLKRKQLKKLEMTRGIVEHLTDKLSG